MTIDDEKLALESLVYVRAHKRELIAKVISPDTPKIENPVAVFMAGTPGAGKTEISKRVAELFTVQPARIDADELREFIPAYDGKNSHVVQSAATIAVDKVVDEALGKRLPFILDATFAVGKATVNIKRCVRRGYDTQLYFVYQDPVLAWRFTQIRERNEGRHVPKEAFIHAYFKSRENVQKVKQEFGDKVTLHLIIRNYETEDDEIYVDIIDIEKYLPKLYNEEELKGLLDG